VRRIADNGFSTLLMPDVLQWQPAPGPTLAVAATLADLRVGTWVYASPLRTPWSLAWEAHSLSVLTEGRFEMGIGTGRPGIEDELRELGLPVVTPGRRLSQPEYTEQLIGLAARLTGKCLLTCDDGFAEDPGSLGRGGTRSEIIAAVATGGHPVRR
jgi:alkanesulfonate monooxygenase SsuD/methylene tetrahydromethanopterin reductase-like flavin-dependent oxidoreductase (luciferase family)